ncbi:MAG: DNA mismatch endonuclease Vsr [Bacteroidales bacterium]|nr:DNA mismatch endonuclease Vsr [Candidatus Cacconaster scatequi]
MPDTLTPEQRHNNMSRIRSRDTKPEKKVRKALFRSSFRYRVNVKALPGSPDIVLAKYRTCIFVNGCFWHGHKDCRYATKPKTNAEFWSAKITNNRERDLRDYAFLESLGWRIIVVWECELKKDRIDDTIASVRKQLDANRESWLAEQADRRQRREEWQAEIKKRKIITSTLET